MNAPHLLLTGFEPFAGDSLNPSWELARSLDGEVVGGWRVRALRLPCTFEGAPRHLDQALAERPAAVLAMGLAGGRSALSLERVAVNLVDARIPDNAGAQPIDQPVLADGPPAYFSRLPVKAMWQACLATGVPAELSMSAGSFVCNQLFFHLLHALRERPDVPAGFLHVPLLPEQARAGAPVLPLARQREGLLAMLQVLADGRPECHAMGGALH